MSLLTASTVAVASNFINNALAETCKRGCFADVMACISPAYANIDADRQPTTEHASSFVASTCHNLKRPQAPKRSADKEVSSVIKELQNHQDQCQAMIARLLYENEAMLSLAITFGTKSDVPTRPTFSRSTILSKKLIFSNLKALCHSPRRHSPAARNARSI
jgi:hypothetical protein